MTCGMPPLGAANAGLAHCPSMIFLPGDESFHTSLPVFLLTATKLGAFGAGSFHLASEMSQPLPVTAYTRSPATMGDELASWLGNTPSSERMSRVQRIFALPGFFGSPLKSAQTSSQRLLTYQIRSPSTNGDEAIPCSGSFRSEEHTSELQSLRH